MLLLLVVITEQRNTNICILNNSISIHKSQGSEFDAVIIPIFTEHYMLLQKKLIYTAITRAKKMCIIIGDPKAIYIGIKRNNTNRRITFLKNFLMNEQ